MKSLIGTSRTLSYSGVLYMYFFYISSTLIVLTLKLLAELRTLYAYFNGLYDYPDNYVYLTFLQIFTFLSFYKIVLRGKLEYNICRCEPQVLE